MDFGYRNCWGCPVSLGAFVVLAGALFLVAVLAFWLRAKGYRTRPLGNGLLVIVAVVWLLQFGRPPSWGIIPFQAANGFAVFYGAGARALLLIITVGFALPLAAVARKLARRPN